MSSIFKFYMKRKPNSKKVILEPFEGQNMENYVGRKILRGVQIKKEETDFEVFEVLFCATSLSIKEVRGIDADLDSIKPEIIKHANDVNSKTDYDLKELAKNDQLKPAITIEQIQDIIDTSNLYGQEFLKSLMALLEEYPIKVEMVKVQESDEAAFQRKVSKG